MTAQTAPQATCRVVERDGRIFVSWRAQTPELFGLIKDDWRAAMPTHQHCSWSEEARAWSCAGHWRERVAAWVAATFPPESVTWEREQHRERRQERQQARQQARPKGQRQVRAGGTAGLEGAYRTLHLRKSAPPSVVQATHRALAKTLHPDAGGDELAMRRLNHSYNLIMAALEPATSAKGSTAR